MLTIQNVKYLGKKVEWSFNNSSTSGGNEWSKDAPLPEFKNALQAFTEFDDRMPLSPAMYGELTVNGITLKESKGEYVKVSVSYSAEVPDQQPFNFVYHFDLLNEDNSDIAAAVDVLVEQTKRYIKGERQQGELFAENGEDTGEPEEEPEDDNLYAKQVETER